MAKTSPVQDYVNEVSEAQARVAEKRADVADALVEHMLKLPGMSDIFDSDMEKQMFGAQIANMVEMAARAKAERALLPQPPSPEPVQPENGDQT